MATNSLRGVCGALAHNIQFKGFRSHKQCLWVTAESLTLESFDHPSQILHALTDMQCTINNKLLRQHFFSMLVFESKFGAFGESGSHQPYWDCIVCNQGSWFTCTFPSRNVLITSACLDYDEILFVMFSLCAQANFVAIVLHAHYSRGGYRN